MRLKNALCLITALLVIGIYWNVKVSNLDENKVESIKVGFIYVGDAGNAYTYNFIRAENEIKEKYTDSVECIDKYNVPEGQEESAIIELINDGCNLIFGASYGYKDTFKTYAEKYPKIQFCMATADNAEASLKNYHTFMGEIYQGRYICGVVAGLKLKQLIDDGIITSDQALIGYVGAFPFAEVISGYTSFVLGARSIVPEAKMVVKYSNTWNDYIVEKNIAKELIEDGCVIISQHSDTAGPAVMCESYASEKPVFHISYNQSMKDVAPTTSMTGCRINWTPYMLGAVEATLKEKNIEKYINAKKAGHDSYAGFDKDWVQMLEINELILPEGTKKKVNKLVSDFKQDKIDVFKGDYLGVNPFDPNDTYDLNKGFKENDKSSAPQFSYVLKDIITIKE